MLIFIIIIIIIIVIIVIIIGIINILVFTDNLANHFCINWSKKRRKIS